MNRYQTTKIILWGFMTCISLVMIPHTASADRSLIRPLIYPLDTVQTDRPWFIWIDIHNSGEKNLFRLTLKETTGSGGKTEVFTFEPTLFYRTYYAFRPPVKLTGAGYEYRIEMLVNGKPVKYSYYYYLKYPVGERFSIGKGDSVIDTLPRNR